MKNPDVRAGGLLLALWLALVSAALWSRPLMPIDETRYLSVAWEMWQKGEFLVPHLNGLPYSHKPPFFFWCIHLGWLLFGVNEASARLTAPVFGLLNLFLTGHLAARLWPQDKDARRLAPFVLMGLSLWAAFETLTMFDMLLTFFVLWAAVGVLAARGGKFVYGWSLYAAAVGGGILTKGPVVLLYVLPLMLAAPWWAVGKPVVSWRRWYVCGAAALAGGAALALAWALPAARAGGPAYADAILWGQTAGRVVHSFAHRKPFWWYLLWLPAILYPWIVHRRLWSAVKKLGSEQGVRFCLSWLVPAVALLSLVSGKQVHYLLPVLPAAGLLVARSLSVSPAGPSLAERLAVAVPVLTAGVVLMIMPLVIPHLPDLNLHGFSSWAWGLVPLALGAWILADRFRHVRAWAQTVAVAFVTLLVVLHLGPVRAMAPAYDIGQLSHKIAAAAAGGHPVAVFPAKFDGQFEFLGRLETPLVVLENFAAVSGWLARHPDGYLAIVFKNANWHAYGEGAEYVQEFRSGGLAFWRAAALAQKLGSTEKQGLKTLSNRPDP